MSGELPAVINFQKIYNPNAEHIPAALRCFLASTDMSDQYAAVHAAVYNTLIL